MKSMYPFLFIQIASAHELEEATNLAEAEWGGPVTALLIIVAVIAISRKIIKGSK